MRCHHWCFAEPRHILSRFSLCCRLARFAQIAPVFLIVAQHFRVWDLMGPSQACCEAWRHLRRWLFSFGDGWSRKVQIRLGENFTGTFCRFWRSETLQLQSRFWPHHLCRCEVLHMQNVKSRRVLEVRSLTCR